eukprot:m.163634 g.163634  ORF g.163634 m.163634 type:complete len:61 (+) comp24918_c0_seq18:1051-1233(+)
MTMIIVAATIKPIVAAFEANPAGPNKDGGSLDSFSTHQNYKLCLEVDEALGWARHADHRT